MAKLLQTENAVKVRFKHLSKRLHERIIEERCVKIRHVLQVEMLCVNDESCEEDQSYKQD